MASYLVESYVPKLAEEECRRAASSARAAAEELSRDGSSIRYVRSLFVTEDETCFHIFEAPSEEAVAAASRLAGLGSVRIVPVRLDR